jgi:hypothetical protein
VIAWHELRLYRFAGETEFILEQLLLHGCGYINSRCSGASSRLEG